MKPRKPIFTEQIHIRLSPAEKHKLLAHVEKLGMPWTVSTWMRRGPQTDFLRPVLVMLSLP